MWRTASIACATAAAPLLAALLPAPVDAAPEQRTVLNGQCHYPDRIARHRFDTDLVLCDTATIVRAATNTTLDFGRRSWGSSARFTGIMTGNRMAISQVSRRGNQPVAATGTCELVYLEDGQLSAISCLAKTDPRPIAANFLPSRL